MSDVACVTKDTCALSGMEAVTTATTHVDHVPLLPRHDTHVVLSAGRRVGKGARLTARHHQGR